MSPVRTLDPNADLRAQVVDKLRDLLTRAEAGEFVSMIFIGQGGSIWVKGPREMVERRNANGGTYQEEQMKAVYISDGAKRKTAARKAPARPRKAPRAKGKAARGATGRGKGRSFPAATLHPLSEYRHMNSWW